VILVDRIEVLMRKHGIKTRKECELLCGLANGALGKWEAGAFRPSTSSLEKVAQYFGVSVDYLLGNTDETAPFTAPTGDEKIDILARAARKMTEEEKDKLIEMAKVLFRKAFDESDRT
jgi:transcriptional regulator with XRE-family HTH domain